MLLGEIALQKRTFSGLDAVFKKFSAKDFQKLGDRKRSDYVNQVLLDLIRKASEPCFLLSSVLDFIERVDQEKILHHYTFNSFELWLNQVSGLTAEENREIRGKIVGKKIEREGYQALFPIGMGKVYSGTHFVTAHKSPDLDTTVASFWGWVDAFGARVGDALHVWNLPGGPPSSQIEIEWIFRGVFGPAVFTHLAKSRTLLNLTGNDLMTQKKMVRKGLSESLASVDHDREHPAVVIVDSDGFYLGDWRNFDAEGVHQVIILFSSCLRWFENTLHLQLISLFAEKTPSFEMLQKLVTGLFDAKLSACEPALEFTQKQKKELAGFAADVLHLKKGFEATFEEVWAHLQSEWGVQLEGSKALLSSTKTLFDKSGKLKGERPHIFTFLEGVVRKLHEVILQVRKRLEKLDVALQTKQTVFGHNPTFVTVRSDVEEIRQKMGSYRSLTVVYPDQGKMCPVGVILSADLRKPILGTVSLRDFCNREEMGIPPYLDVISVIDHHKSEIQTLAPPFAVIADAQSCNTLVARQAFMINDRYSTGGQALKTIEAQMKESPSPEILQRLLQRKIVVEKGKQNFIHPEREYIEYLHFLYGILDDTDLLSKVSALDVEVVAALLNRLKSLSEGKEMEIISLRDIPQGPGFEKKAAERILRHDEMYSLYKKVYAYREKEVERVIASAAIFADTKEQNGCCRIGQLKIFSRNAPVFAKAADNLRKAWLDASSQVVQDRSEIDLHLYMISTIVSAEEVYKGEKPNYPHKDELWIWIPETELAIEHLKRFLSAFQVLPALHESGVEVEFLGENSGELKSIFRESFLDVPQKVTNKKLPIAVIRYRAGSVNSRKAMISPYLPA